MRILYIVPNLPFRPLSGGSVRSYYLTKEWSQRHQVDLVAPIFEPVSQNQVDQYAQELQASLHPVMAHSYTGWAHQSAYARRVLQGAPPFLHYPELIAYLEQLSTYAAFDVIQVEGSGFGGSLYFEPFLRQSPRPKLMLTFLDILWHWWKREFFHSPRLSSLIRWLVYRIWEPKFVQCADCCVFMSPVDRAIVEQVVQPKQVVIGPTGVDVDAFPVTPVPNTKDILFVGSFRHQPNLSAAHWLLNEIYPKLCQHRPDVMLHLAGLTPPTSLIDLAASVGAQIHADVTDLRPLYQTARVVVVPIQTGGGIRVKILEACVASRTLVTTTLGAEGLPIVDGVHGLFADSVADFVDAILRVIDDERLAQTLAANGRLLVQKEFAWPQIAQKIERAFTD